MRLAEGLQTRVEAGVRRPPDRSNSRLAAHLEKGGTPAIPGSGARRAPGPRVLCALLLYHPETPKKEKKRRERSHPAGRRENFFWAGGEQKELQFGSAGGEFRRRLSPGRSPLSLCAWDDGLASWFVSTRVACYLYPWGQVGSAELGTEQ